MPCEDDNDILDETTDSEFTVDAALDATLEVEVPVAGVDPVGFSFAEA